LTGCQLDGQGFKKPKKWGKGEKWREKPVQDIPRGGIRGGKPYKRGGEKKGEGLQKGKVDGRK